MSNDKPLWEMQLADSPFLEGHFTNNLKLEVVRRTKLEKRKKHVAWRASVLLVPLTLVTLLIGLWAVQPGAQSPGSPGLNDRTAYNEMGAPLFTIYPDPLVRAGETAGYLFSFGAPFETFDDKEMTIHAEHRRTGVKEALSSELVTEPSGGYESLNRYTVKFALPISGEWIVSVLLDGSLYGAALLELEDPEPWTASPFFSSGTYQMRGTEGEIGILDVPFLEDQGQKVMWHFWGDDEQLNGPFQVKAVKENSETIIEVFSSNVLSSSNALSGAHNGADRHAVTSIRLPDAGKWRLLPYVQGKLLDSIIVEVEQRRIVPPLQPS